MEIKKNPKVDLTRKSWLFFNISLAFVLFLVNTAFEWRSEKAWPLVDFSTATIDLSKEWEEPMLTPPLPAQEAASSPQTNPQAAERQHSEEIIISVHLDVEGSGITNQKITD